MALLPQHLVLLDVLLDTDASKEHAVLSVVLLDRLVNHSRDFHPKTQFGND